MRKPTRMSLYLSGSQKAASLEACAEAGRGLRGSTGQEEAGMADLGRCASRLALRVLGSGLVLVLVLGLGMGLG